MNRLTVLSNGLRIWNATPMEIALLEADTARIRAEAALAKQRWPWQLRPTGNVNEHGEPLYAWTRDVA